MNFIKNQIERFNQAHWDVKARLFGNILAVVGYFLLLHVHPILGGIVKLASFAFITPFCVRAKLWDVVTLFGFFGAIDLSNLIKLLFF